MCTYHSGVRWEAQQEPHSIADSATLTQSRCRCPRSCQEQELVYSSAPALGRGHSPAPALGRGHGPEPVLGRGHGPATVFGCEHSPAPVFGREHSLVLVFASRNSFESVFASRKSLEAVHHALRFELELRQGHGRLARGREAKHVEACWLHPQVEQLNAVAELRVNSTTDRMQVYVR